MDPESFFSEYSKKELREILEYFDVTPPIITALKAEFIDTAAAALGDRMDDVQAKFIPRRRKSGVTRTLTDSEAEADETPRKRPRRSRTPTRASRRGEPERIEEVAESQGEGRRHSFEVTMSPIINGATAVTSPGADKFLRSQTDNELRSLLEMKGIPASHDESKDELVRKAEQAFDSVESGELPALSEYFKNCSARELKEYLQQRGRRVPATDDVDSLVPLCIDATSGSKSDQTDAMWNVWGGKHWTTTPFVHSIEPETDQGVTYANILLTGLIGALRAYGWRGSINSGTSFADSIIPGSSDYLTKAVEDDMCKYATIAACALLILRGSHLLKFVIGATLGLILASSIAGWVPAFWPVYAVAFVLGGVHFSTSKGLTSLMAALVASYIGSALGERVVELLGLTGPLEALVGIALPIGILAKIGKFWYQIPEHVRKFVDSFARVDSCKALIPLSIRAVAFSLASEIYTIISIFVFGFILLMSVSASSETVDSALGSSPKDALDIGNDAAMIVRTIVTIIVVGIVTVFAEQNEGIFLRILSPALGAYILLLAFPGYSEALFGFSPFFVLFPFGCYVQCSY